MMNDWREKLRKEKQRLFGKKNNPMSKMLNEKLSDGKKHKVRTTSFPTLWVDKIKMYEGKNTEKLDSFFYGVFVGFAVAMATLLVITLIALR